MVGKVQMWGNSLAVRIPSTYAKEIGFARDGKVELRVSDGMLVIAPKRARRYTLKGLLKRVKRSALHEAVEFGAPMGREAL